MVGQRTANVRSTPSVISLVSRRCSIRMVEFRPPQQCRLTRVIFWFGDPIGRSGVRRSTYSGVIEKRPLFTTPGLVGVHLRAPPRPVGQRPRSMRRILAHRGDTPTSRGKKKRRRRRPDSIPPEPRSSRPVCCSRSVTAQSAEIVRGPTVIPSRPKNAPSIPRHSGIEGQPVRPVGAGPGRRLRQYHLGASDSAKRSWPCSRVKGSPAWLMRVDSQRRYWT